MTPLTLADPGSASLGGQCVDTVETSVTVSDDEDRLSRTILITFYPLGARAPNAAAQERLSWDGGIGMGPVPRWLGALGDRDRLATSMLINSEREFDVCHFRGSFSVCHCWWTASFYQRPARSPLPLPPPRSAWTTRCSPPTSSRYVRARPSRW